MSVLSDLVLVCAGAPLIEHRQQADALLGRELLARIDRLSRQYDLSSFPLTGSGGVYRAGVYSFNLPPSLGNIQALGGGTSGSKKKGKKSVYDAVLADVTALGSALVDEVTDQAGASFFTSRRRSVRQVIASGELYPLEFFPTQRPGGTEPADGAFRFNTGDWVIHFTGIIYSADPANPATAYVSLAGASRSVVRTDAKAGMTVEQRRSQAVEFDVQATASYASPHVVFLQNASSFDQFAVGTLWVTPG